MPMYIVYYSIQENKMFDNPIKRVREDYERYDEWDDEEEWDDCPSPPVPTPPTEKSQQQSARVSEFFKF